MTDDTPAPARGTSFAGKLLALLGVALSCAYLANLGAGVLGEIPDIIPGAGNLDEVFFSALLIVCLHYLGINIVPRTSVPGIADRGNSVSGNTASGNAGKHLGNTHTETQRHRE